MSTVTLNQDQIAAAAAHLANQQRTEGVSFTPADLIAAIIEEIAGRELDESMASILVGVVATLARYEKEQHVPFHGFGRAPAPVLH